MAALGITLLKNNVPWGPFTRAQIDEGLMRGDFTVRNMAHAPGMTEWRPLNEVLDFVERNSGPALPPLPPVPGARELPPVPQAAVTVAPFAPITPAPVPVPRPPVLPAPVARAFTAPAPPRPEIRSETKMPAQAETHDILLTRASFVPRAIAFFIDCAILFVPVLLLYALGGLAIEIPGKVHGIDHESRMQAWALLDRNMRELAGLVAIGFGWLYGAGYESSKAQATIGKRWMGIKVTDMKGERLGFLHASARCGAKYLSALPCFLGFIMALFSSRNLALHDRLTGTRVVRK